jgi:hypothetical protein
MKSFEIWGCHSVFWGCYGVSLGKCFETLNAVILGSSSPRTVIDSMIKRTEDSTPLTPKPSVGASPPRNDTWQQTLEARTLVWAILVL